MRTEDGQASPALESVLRMDQIAQKTRMLQPYEDSKKLADELTGIGCDILDAERRLAIEAFGSNVLPPRFGAGGPKKPPKK